MLCCTYLQILRLEGELCGLLPQLLGQGAVVRLQLDALLLQPVQLTFQNLNFY